MYSRESGVTIKVGPFLLHSGLCSGVWGESSRELKINASIVNVLPSPISFTIDERTPTYKFLQPIEEKGKHLHQQEDHQGKAVVVQLVSSL